MAKVIRVDWSKEAEQNLKSIYYFHTPFSEESAFMLVTNIKIKADSIIFPKQYQVDEYNPKYRRMIFGDYKILFREKKSIVYIVAIFSSKNNPVMLGKVL